MRVIVIVECGMRLRKVRRDGYVKRIECL
jgi:hypothetical protein